MGTLPERASRPNYSPALCVGGAEVLLPGKKAEPALGTASAPLGPTMWRQANIWGSTQHRNVWLPSLTQGKAGSGAGRGFLGSWRNGS